MSGNSAVASEMIAPRLGGNTAMQLNIGKGKSSIIVPIIVVILADGDQLVRVIVLKALTAQMFHLLAGHLGGLVNRTSYSQVTVRLSALWQREC